MNHKPYFCLLSDKWRNNREREKAETLNLSGFPPFIASSGSYYDSWYNYTKNPLLVRVFHEMSWVEDLDSGIRNILRYAPLYYSDYRIEINNGSQFIFSITYMDVAENVRDKTKMSETDPQNVRDKTKMSETDPQNVRDNDISGEDLTLEIGESPSVKEKKKRRKQGIVGLIASIPNITVDMLSEKMGVNEKTIRRDLVELREQGIIERVGGDFGGHWVICRKRH